MITKRTRRDGVSLSCFCGWNVHSIPADQVEVVSTLHERFSTKGLGHVPEDSFRPLRPNTEVNRLMSGNKV